MDQLHSLLGVEGAFLRSGLVVKELIYQESELTQRKIVDKLVGACE